MGAGQSACHGRNGLSRAGGGGRARAGATGPWENQASAPPPRAPIGRIDPPRAPPAPINTTAPRASPHSSAIARPRRTRPAFTFPDQCSCSVTREDESHNGDVRDRRLGASYRRWPGAEASRRRER
ncbi:unnamed protein product, partial [Iphiclides podalirius]